MLFLVYLVSIGLFLLAGSLDSSESLRHQGLVLAIFAGSLLVGAAVIDGFRSVLLAMRQRERV